MGQMPPLLMPKREVTRFLERIGEHEKALSLRAAKQEAAAAQSELERSDKPDASLILAPGSKRRAALDVEWEARDEALDEWLEGMSDDDESRDAIRAEAARLEALGAGAAGGVLGDDDEEEDEDYAEDALPDLKGVGKKTLRAARGALGARWRWASVDELGGLSGVSALQALPEAIPAAIVAAAWHVTVLRDSPAPSETPPVLASAAAPPKKKRQRVKTGGQAAARKRQRAAGAGGPSSAASVEEASDDEEEPPLPVVHATFAAAAEGTPAVSTAASPLTAP
ncbi:hypothetical protein EMIHUDRAFT_458697 [Emiliania huxleyi CCMP1516]|uniref:Uncharacterized protein n=2 Tax=Emiliania huxleyi TaxID=2903 RepID=A0A0D3J863_EMIH1|nr:hypothetical protein EMIHUDRAFT_458697 [Emiliania huxleyi CCMP1516]EOD19698.1 hypothetical protein EMIHUDRAFT_458697 [Emiliania huxleyi CCMP1516]|eukprot:XP_005772127.1 hypothetical protein EMIHUDRAFT_458697 [Emiliania huxleyi CCMP1516]